MASLNSVKELTVPSIQISNNVITYNDSFICIDNISLITISPVPSNKSWIYACIIGALGTAISDLSTFLAGLMIITSLIWIAAVIWYNINRGDNLQINLNSGMSLYFHCQNREFLNQVVKLLLQKMDGKKTETTTIKFDSCTISGGSFFNQSTIK
ncbi:hypothetical protein Osc1_09270 [Hominimerdicola sp. 21CYCFAH17_S]